MKLKDDNIDKKKYCDNKRGMVRRDCLQSFPTNIGHSQQTEKRQQRKIDGTVERSTDNLPAEENEKLY